MWTGMQIRHSHRMKEKESMSTCKADRAKFGMEKLKVR